MSEQFALTVIVTIRPEGVDSLRTLLGERIGGTEGEPGCPIDFRKLTVAHFLRWVILDKSHAKGHATPSQLVLSTNHDGPLDAHLRELVDVGGATIEEIYSHCEGRRPGQDLATYLKEHRVEFAAFYRGTQGRSVCQIRKEQELREGIQLFLDGGAKANAGETDGDVRRRVQDFVRDTPTLAWAQQPGAALPKSRLGLLVAAAVALLVAAIVAVVLMGSKLRPWLLPATSPAWLGTSICWLVAVVAVFWPLLLLIVCLVIVFIRERHEPGEKIRINQAHIKKFVIREDQIVQNQLSHLVEIKPGWVRFITLRVVLWAINLLGRCVFTRGSLGGIPTIHFARWVIIDRRGRLLFFSNFDGSWENYLGDFIDKAAQGLTAVWSNTKGCPRAKFLVLEGARDEQRFKSWARDRQIVTQVWYSAYRDLTVVNINNNTAIRNGLFANLDPEAERVWASRL